ncbi:hypothetical protein [Nonomuraea sp. NPDC050643]|uniref:hypothetical protein n=1 Tax=Nonomuraea sp. NPDC050643 TaxID=3155660 RepID=UPI0033F6A0B9
MTADQSLVCPTCRGVPVSMQAASYTPARGRLIVTNGYCPGHDEPEHAPADGPERNESAAPQTAPIPATRAH